MKITYEFVNEKIVIEIPKEWCAEIIELNKLKYNNNSKETRRHVTLFNGIDDGERLATKENADYILCNGIFYDLADERLRSAFNKLTEKQKGLIDCVYYKGMSYKEYAEHDGVTKSVVTLRHQAMLRKLKKY